MSKATPNNKEQLMNQDDFIVSKTDLKGNITYCNEIFMKFAGLSEKDLLAKPHNIIRHPDMPRIIFKLLWERIKSRKEIFAYVKNLSNDGSYYWVYANITASIDTDDKLLGYYSVRRKPKESALKVITPLYEELLKKERSGGIDAASAYLEGVLKKAHLNYDEFINSLQNGAY